MPLPARVLAYLSAIDSQPSISQGREGWAVSSCPLAPWTHKKGTDKKPAFGIKIEGHNGPWQTHCFACGHTGDQFTLLLDIREYTDQDYQNWLRDNGGVAFPGLEEAHREVRHRLDLAFKTFSLDPADQPQDFKLPTYENDPWNNGEVVFPESYLEPFEPAWDDYYWTVHPYLEERGVSLQVARAWDIRWDAYSHRICFPVRDMLGRLRGVQGRVTVEGVEPRWKHYKLQDRFNADMWMGENRYDPTKPVVIVEGGFDGTSVYRVYRNVLVAMGAVTANPGTGMASGWNKIKLDRLCASKPTGVITLADPDGAGDQMRKAVSAQLPDAVHVILPEGTDPGSATQELLVEKLGNLVELDPIIVDDKKNAA